MTPDALIAIIILLVGGYWVQLIYRLHKAESEIAEIRKEFTKAFLDASTAALAASNALVAAAQAIRKNGHK